MCLEARKGRYVQMGAIDEAGYAQQCSAGLHGYVVVRARRALLDDGLHCCPAWALAVGRTGLPERKGGAWMVGLVSGNWRRLRCLVGVMRLQFRYGR